MHGDMYCFLNQQPNHIYSTCVRDLWKKYKADVNLPQLSFNEQTGSSG